jgi:hypothetical protein
LGKSWTLYRFLTRLLACAARTPAFDPESDFPKIRAAFGMLCIAKNEDSSLFATA